MPVTETTTKRRLFGPLPRCVHRLGGWAAGRLGGGRYETPSVLVVYRDDQRFNLDAVIPRIEWHGDGDEQTPTLSNAPDGYDLVIAAQPFRARAPAPAKTKNVLLPMTRALRSGGRMVVIQSTGMDPAMEIVHKIWPDEAPFATPRHMLQVRLASAWLPD